MTRCPWCFRPLPSGATSPCPACRQDLPAGWAGVPTTCVAMAGARTTGKSIFVAVMIKQLRLVLRRIGTTVEPADARVARAFAENYERQLYEERGILAPTGTEVEQEAHQRAPLVYAVTTRDGHRHHLVLRDVAGEDLEKSAEEKVAADLSFFAHADAVFFLYDPLKEPAIAGKLHDLDEHVPTKQLGSEPEAVFRAVQRLIGAGEPRLAMIMSKFDVVQALRGVEGGGRLMRIMANPGAAMVRDPGPVGTVAEADVERLHQEVRSLLMMLDAGWLVGTVDHLAHRGLARFFAVSALGGPAVGGRLDPRGIAPYRCLDPLRWALAGSGVL